MPAILLAVGLIEAAVAILLFERWRAAATPPVRTSWALRRATPSPAARPPRPGAAPPRLRLAGEPLRVTLDIEVDQANTPTVARIVHEAAMRAMDRDPTAHTVTVHDRRGVLLGRQARPEPLASLPEPPSAATSAAPRLRGRTPRVVQAKHVRHPTISHDDVAAGDLHVEGRPLAQRFDLPDSVRSRLRVEDDEVELVRAILDAAGLRPRVRGDILQCGSRSVVVIGPHLPHGRTGEALSRAYLRFVDTRAESGVCIAFTHLDQREVRRRELLAPALRHVTSAGVQRMADAVALGADPLAFAAGPVLVRA